MILHGSNSLMVAVLVSATGFAQSSGPAQTSASCIRSGTLAAALSGAAPLRSPELSPNGQVTLRLCAPEAASVRVVGDWNSEHPKGDPLVKG